MSSYKYEDFVTSGSRHDDKMLKKQVIQSVDMPNELKLLKWKSADYEIKVKRMNSFI